jgi:mRNA interferase RelE/StbE
VARLLALEDNPRPSGVKKLQGQESYRLRVGDYRILYTIDDKSKKIFIMAVGHRREVYR